MERWCALVLAYFLYEVALLLVCSAVAGALAPGHALVDGAMVGVGVADGGGGPGPGPAEPYPAYGEYYSDQYYVPDMCSHPQQHPQHAHVCTLPPEYGGMQVVTSTTMMPQMMPPVMDENMRHYLVHQQAHPHPHHGPHHQPPLHQPPHHQPPHHQPPHHYGPTNGAGGPQHFYSGGYHYHVPAQHHMQHSPPPVFQNERAQRQYVKLKQKLERKQNNRNNGIEVNSGASTPSLSPRKDMNGRGGGSGGASSGAWSEGEGSSAGASVQGDDDTDTQAVLDMLSATRTPQVSDMTSTSALVQWNSSLPEGVTVPNIELTYELLLGDRGRYKAIYSGPSLSCRVRDLRPGCEYSVCLQIRSGELTGAASEAATFRAPPAPPEPLPAPRVSTRLRTSITLRWSTVHDNGARVTHYVIEMDAGEGFAELARPRTRQHTANNLRPQTRYSFRIAAVNECGRGSWSDEAVTWTAGSPPPAPAPPQLCASEPDSLSLGWESRAGEEYTLQMDDAARGHGFLPVYAGPDAAYVCAGLRRATDYRFRLRSETSDGQGPWSADVTYRTQPERPAAPGRPAPKGKIHSRAFRLRWDPPHEDGGAPLDSYTLELDAGEGYRRAYSGPECEAHCDRLRPGTPYRARVRCASLAGESDWSPTETVTTEPAVPSAPSAPEPVAAPRPTELRVRWRAPECTGGVPLTEYRLEVEDAGAETASEARTAPPGPGAGAALATERLVRDLVPGRRYRAHVSALNALGASPASPPLEFATPAAPPAAPAPPIARAQGPRTARLEWTPPADNGAPVLDYRLEMSSCTEADSFAEVYRGTEPACAVGELVPFSPYLFRVCARNAAGRGAWSGAGELLTPRAPPAAPAGLRHEAAADSLRLAWRVPAAHGAEVLRYRLMVDDLAIDTDDPTPERLVCDLLPDTAYRVRVAALNELGLGDWSEELRAHTRPPPPAPPRLRVTEPAAHNHLRLEWEASGGEGAAYCVEMRCGEAREFRPVYRGSARSCKAKKLREATEYWFRIRASDERGGRGPWSEPMTARTTSAPPPALRPPTLTPPAAGSRRSLVTWDAVDDAEYTLQCARAKEPVFKEVYAGRETSFELSSLESGAEYLVRVCCVRGGQAGAWSGAARVAVPAAPPAPPAARAPRRVPRAPARALQPRQLALLVAVAFLLLAVLMAVLLERIFVEPQP